MEGKNGAQRKFDPNIVHHYKTYGSLKQTAKLLGCSEQRVKKTVISSGDYCSEISIAILALYEKGLSQGMIADLLNCSYKVVNMNLPYLRGQYKLPEPSKNARTIRQWRERKGKMKKSD